MFFLFYVKKSVLPLDKRGEVVYIYITVVERTPILRGYRMTEMQAFVKAQLKLASETIGNIGNESEFSYLFEGNPAVTMDDVVSILEGTIKTIKSAS